jgi:hypothetical protein
MSAQELEQLKSASGVTIFRLNGKMLSSKVDPRKEAIQWVENNQFLSGVSKTIVVIGVGSGYHLIALKEKYPQARILAISTCAELLNAIQNAHAQQLSGVTFYNATTLEDFYEAEATQAVFQSTAVVLKHPTYQVEDNPLLEQIIEAIVARSTNSLKKYIAKNEALTVALPAIPAMIGLASIKTINDAAVSTTETQFVSPWLTIRTLKELVK